MTTVPLPLWSFEVFMRCMCRRSARPVLEPLEDRCLLSAAPSSPLPDVQMTGATTTDARTVRVNYDIAGAAVTGQPLTFNVYRSANYDSLDGARFLGSSTLPASDAADLSEGGHQGVKLALTDGSGRPVTALTPSTALPFLVIVANPTGSIQESNTANNTASFETHVLGVVAHGLELMLGGTTPSWETQLAGALQSSGYEAVIAFNWVRASHRPFAGLAMQAGDQLAAQVIAEANQLAAQHPGDVVDVNFIGHSRGGVVISRALQDLVGTTDPALEGGYLQMTLLDPHPANNRFGPFGFLPFSKLSVAAGLVTLVFQALARDPQVVVPPDVMQAQLFYQDTPAEQFFPKPGEFFLNLWGDGPGQIVNQSGRPLESMNLTDVNAPGVGFVGHSEVHQWYQVDVVDAGKTFDYFG